jgi:hypothetical protein
MWHRVVWCFPVARTMMVLSKLRCTVMWYDVNCVIAQCLVSLWVWQSVCSSYCGCGSQSVPVTVSGSQSVPVTVGVAVSLFQLLCVWKSVCSSYCECNSQSVPVTVSVAVILFQLLWVWQSTCSSYCECGSQSVSVTAVSFSTALHVAPYRSIYCLLTWYCLLYCRDF